MDKELTDMDIDTLVDRATEQIAGSRPDPAVISAAALRVRECLASGAEGSAARAADIEQITGCGDYQRLIPAYLEGGLPEARRLLLEDHSRECVPCRKALKAAKSGELHQPLVRSDEPVPKSKLFRWAMAAAMVAGLGLSLLLAWRLMPLNGGASAVFESARGDLYRVGSASQIPLDTGAVIRAGESVRTGREGGALVKLNDGSLVEMRARSEMIIDEGRRGTTLKLARGSVIVRAAPQRQKKLYVATEDCLVSVVGTIFSVEHGTKGSRVAVIEGEVWVDHKGEEKVLLSGQQMATHASLVHKPISEEIAWSKDVDHYLSLLRELSALRQDIQRSFAAGELRYSSQLLDLMPEDTILYAALPNLATSIQDVHAVIERRINQSNVLRQWWQEQAAASGFEEKLEDAVGVLGQFGDYLGGEIAIGGMLATAGQAMGPLVLAELRDGPGFRQFLQQLAEQWGQGGEVIFVEDPSLPVVGKGLFLWVREDLVVASPQIDRLEQVGALLRQGEENPFVGSPFHAEISGLYDDGAEILVAANLETVLNTTFPVQGESAERLDALGLNGIRHILLERKHSTGETHHRAAVTFREERRGLASWIAEPAPMGSLDFISPDAKFFSAFVFKDPAALLQDIQSFVPRQGFAELLATLQGSLGIDLEQDFAEALGGEIAVAIDGPLLPTPSWKAIIETYDPARIQWVFEQMVNAANKDLRAGKDPLEITETRISGRTFYTLPIEILKMHYTFVEGYLLVAPSRALLDRAIRFQQSGYTISTSERFTALLPTDTQQNFSALFYQDLTSLLEPLLEGLGDGVLTPEQREALGALKGENGSTLGYVYGHPRRITLAVAGQMDILTGGLLAVLGFENPAGIAGLFEQAAGGR